MEADCNHLSFVAGLFGRSFRIDTPPYHNGGPVALDANLPTWGRLPPEVVTAETTSLICKNPDQSGGKSWYRTTSEKEGRGGWGVEKNAPAAFRKTCTEIRSLGLKSSGSTRLRNYDAMVICDFGRDCHSNVKMADTAVHLNAQSMW